LELHAATASAHTAVRSAAPMRPLRRPLCIPDLPAFEGVADEFEQPPECGAQR
jgi:hypothetical protein